MKVTREVVDYWVEYYIVLKFEECGNANRVKQRLGLFTLYLTVLVLIISTVRPMYSLFQV